MIHQLKMFGNVQQQAPNKANALGRLKAPLVPRYAFCRR